MPVLRGGDPRRGEEVQALQEMAERRARVTNLDRDAAGKRTVYNGNGTRNATKQKSRRVVCHGFGFSGSYMHSSRFVAAVLYVFCREILISK